MIFPISIPCIINQLVQFKPTNTYSFTKITIKLQNTNSSMFRLLLAHHQGANSSTKQLNSSTQQYKTAKQQQSAVQNS
jgi:hypothetical protein